MSISTFPGPGVESADSSARRQVGDIGDAADVDDDAMNLLILEQCRVKRRHQRRTLSAGGDVAAPEVRHDGDVGALRDACRDY